jgi:hypothetical protein
MKAALQLSVTVEKSQSILVFLMLITFSFMESIYFLGAGNITDYIRSKTWTRRLGQSTNLHTQMTK